MTTRSSAQAVARALVKIGAVGFSMETPITFKSGMKSPVYVDNRRLPYYPEHWRVVLDGFAALVAEKKLSYDVIAGIETAGIPHSAALGFLLKQPSVFVRKQVKDHGTKSRIEGGAVSGKRVLLVEDLVTTGSSSLSGVEALREAGALSTDCLAIVSYAFPDAKKAFASAKVTLHPLTSFQAILQEAVKQAKITSVQRAVVEEWLADPWKWSKKYQ
jgi:orotate phosphoribosyltransferase